MSRRSIKIDSDFYEYCKKMSENLDISVADFLKIPANDAEKVLQKIEKEVEKSVVTFQKRLQTYLILGGQIAKVTTKKSSQNQKMTTDFEEKVVKIEKRLPDEKNAKTPFLSEKCGFSSENARARG